uniref:Uncharacterized protein n=1 Tax=Pristionchus pacificus TaxID=54126 RepID=A0A2A6CKR2_PRIPA|eukprot:PDM78696.1 hypothetical protein PRIPAC_31275 [Pristionchus pacificus]
MSVKTTDKAQYYLSSFTDEIVYDKKRAKPSQTVKTHRKLSMLPMVVLALIVTSASGSKILFITNYEDPNHP